MTGEELKKLFRNKTLLVMFAVLCAATLCFAHLYSHHEQTAYLQQVFSKTGRSYGEQYAAQLQAVRPADTDSYEAFLYAQMEENALADRQFFDNYDALEIYGVLQQFHDSDGNRISPFAMTLMEHKYVFLARFVPQLRTDSSQTDVYFDFATAEIHNDLFVRFGTVLLIFSSVFAVLCVLTAVYEEMLCNTSLLVYSSKYGRRLLCSKIVACVLFASFAFAALHLCGYGFVFGRNDFSGIWQQSVASLNNMCITPQAHGPFVPWGSMTVLKYFVGSLAVGYLLMLSFLLTAAAFAGLHWHILPTAGMFFGLQAAILVAISVYLPSFSSMLFYLLRMTGTGLVYLRGIWFSEGGFLTVIPFAESVGAVCNVIAAVFLLFFSYCRFRRIDI